MSFLFLEGKIFRPRLDFTFLLHEGTVLRTCRSFDSNKSYISIIILHSFTSYTVFVNTLVKVLPGFTVAIIL